MKMTAISSAHPAGPANGTKPLRARRLVVLAFALAGLPTSSASAGETTPVFDLPVDCVPGQTCFIQNFVDVDPGPEFRDYTCGFLGYDGSTGTDFRVPTYREMAAGVAVVAAAAGTVRAVRDGMADIDVGRTGTDAAKGREAGNAVVIVHGDGWETQYSHLRKGSISVRPGEHVEAGSRLGLIGLSGLAEFPHVEFAVRHGDTLVDPFLGPGAPKGCGVEARPLWSDKAMARLDYVATGLLDAGFADRGPELDELERGIYTAASLPAASPAIVFWTYFFGARTGDEAVLRLVAPDGAVLADNRHRYERNKAQASLFGGRKLPAAAWPKGRYTGTFTLTRADGGGRRTVLSVTRVLTIE